MSVAGTTLRAWRHEPPRVCPAIRTGERPDLGHRRPHARLSPGLTVGVLVEAGLVLAVFAMAAPPPALPPTTVTIAILAPPGAPRPRRDVAARTRAGHAAAARNATDADPPGAGHHAGPAGIAA